MGDAIETLYFRFRGPMDWKAIEKGTIAYFKSRKYDIVEPKYKDKGNEFEGVWKADLKVDAYTKVVLNIDFHVIDAYPVSLTKNGKEVQGYNGKLLVFINIFMEDNYDAGGPGGKKEIFEEDSWLHKVYKKVTERDREEDIAGVAIINAHEYLEWLKHECGMDAHV